MQITIEIVVMMVIVLIALVIILGLMASAGNTNKSLLDEFFGKLSSVSKSAPK